MSNYPAVLLKCPIAQNGDRSAVPETASKAGAGRISQEEGWGIWNSKPIGEGGIPPKREDFNSVLYLLSTFICWMQQGGIMQYTATLAYEPGNEVFSAGVKYRCLVANGPGTAKGVVNPSADKTVWSNQDLPSVLAGQITPFYNCKLGGSDGRRLVPWGSTDAYESYVICDGGSDGRGGNVPNLIDKFLLPSNVADAGKTGGGLSLQVPGVTVNGTVGETVLTIDQIPAHSHTGSTSTTGGHSHGRGTMEITGAIPIDDHKIRHIEGAFYQNGSYDYCDNRDSENPSPRASFAASRTWTGYTSYDGTHSHSMNLNNTGGGKGHTHTITSSSETQTLTLDRPPFYRLAYFVKLPE
uniref:Tail fiber protein n=1 Tax=Myoviridae sp. ctrSP6 TaxID=2827712 RepID=A0A8S5TB04_9CAUD|nr:MAG TPA: tail fiber protein [Myoviridae sp. ctrSP6]